MKEYLPFTDKDGNKISLNDLNYSDICNIREQGIEEGYKIEFKSQWDENFKKKHLCQTIASFANAEGGWLLVGIEDGTGNYVGIEKQRSDFSQTIAQKLISVSPRPKFDCRFIHEINNNQKGVLVIQVYEGVNPPYVCNGTIYTRSGSSKVPIKSERSSIDELLNKRIKFDEMLKKFCMNKFVSEKENFPYCTIYLYNYNKKIDYSSYDEKISEIKRIFNEDGGGERRRIVDSIDSVMRIGSEVISANSYTSIEEYFANDNIKLYMPFFKVNNKGIINNWIDTVKEYNSNIDMNDMVIVDGMVTYLTLSGLLESAFKYIKKSGNNLCDYKIVFEYKNVKNIVFYYNNNFSSKEQIDSFIKDIQEGKVFICYLSEIITEPLEFTAKESTVEEALHCAVELLEMRYLRLFGIDGEQFADIYEKSEGKYVDETFSSDTY